MASIPNIYILTEIVVFLHLLFLRQQVFIEKMNGVGAALYMGMLCILTEFEFMLLKNKN